MLLYWPVAANCAVYMLQPNQPTLQQQVIQAYVTAYLACQFAK